MKLDERSQAQLFAVLRDHAEAVRQLQVGRGSGCGGGGGACIRGCGTHLRS